MTLYIAYDLKDFEQVRFIGRPKEMAKELGIEVTSLRSQVCRKTLVSRRYRVEKIEEVEEII